ncbi:MAG: hypothetical protein ACTSUE_17480 [Promethearchaeota archaeon]
MIGATFLEEHESFFKGLGLVQEEIALLEDILKNVTNSPDRNTINYECIKRIVKEKGGKENMAIAALAAIRAYYGDNIIYLLIRSILPSKNKINNN